MNRYDIILGKTPDQVTFFDVSNDIEYMEQKEAGILTFNKTFQDYGEPFLPRAITAQRHYNTLQELWL